MDKRVPFLLGFFLMTKKLYGSQSIDSPLAAEKRLPLQQRTFFCYLDLSWKEIRLPHLTSYPKVPSTNKNKLLNKLAKVNEGRFE